MATSSQVHSVSQMLKAFSLRDVDTMVSRMTEDVVIQASAFISGTGNSRGREGVRKGFAEMEKTLDERHERVRLTPRRYYGDATDADKVLVLADVVITREAGDKFSTDFAYLYTMDGDLIAELATWLDHDEGLAQLGDPVEMDLP